MIWANSEFENSVSEFKVIEGGGGGVPILTT